MVFVLCRTQPSTNQLALFRTVKEKIMGFVSRQHRQEVFVSSQCFFRKCTCVFYIPMHAYDYKYRLLKTIGYFIGKIQKNVIFNHCIFLDLIVFYFYNLNSGFD